MARNKVLTRAIVFMLVFVGVSFLIGKGILERGLLYDYGFYIYGGLGKILLFSLLAFVLFNRDRLKRLKVKNNWQDFVILFFSFVSLSIFYFLEKSTFLPAPTLAGKFVLHGLFLVGFVFLAFGIFGLGFVVKVFKRFKKEIFLFLVFGVLLYLAMGFVWKLWPYFSNFVLKSVAYFLRFFGRVDIPKERVLFFNGFGAEIGEACSGIYSVFLFSMIYLFMVFLDWKHLRKGRAFLLFVPAVAGAFLVNVARIFVLFLIGAFWSREIALGLYHSYSGMIFFLVYFSLFWILFYDWMRKKKKPKKDLLLRNTFYLLLNTLLLSFLGFVFWAINARIYSSKDVGVATSLISAAGLISSIGVFGFNFGLIRFLKNSKNKDKDLNTALSTTALITIVVSVFFLWSVGYFFPKLLFVKKSILLSLLFVFFMVVSGASAILESAFVALRDSKKVFQKNFLFSLLKIVLAFFLVSYGAFGIFGSWMAALFVSVLYSFYLLWASIGYKPKMLMHMSRIRKVGFYNLSNYFSNLLNSLPLLLLPLIVLNILGAEQTAYYYIGMTAASVLFSIPKASSMSLFAEGSYRIKDFREKIRKSFKTSLLLLFVPVVLVIFFGDYFLLIFGKDYALNGGVFFQIVSLSSFFVMINTLVIGVLRTRKKTKELVWLGAVQCFLVFSFIFVFVSKGLAGVAWGWTIGNGVSSLFYLYVLSMCKIE